MKRFVYGATCLLALLATACGNTDRKSSDLPQIDMDVEYPEKEICLQDIAEVSYIPLETSDEMLSDGNLVELSENGIVGVDNANDKVLLFYPDGKIRNLLARKGGGPQEYVRLEDVTVDWKREEIFITHKRGTRIQVYTLDGVYKRTLEVNEMSRQGDLYQFDDNCLLAFKEKIDLEGYNRKVKPYHPVLLISKEDGRIDSLSYLKDYIASLVITNLSAQQPITYPAYVISGNSIYLADMGHDTVYTIHKDGTLSPYLTRTPSVKSDSENAYFLNLNGVVAHYDFITRLSKNWTLGDNFEVMDNNSRSWMHNRKSGEIFQPAFKNQDCPSLKLNLLFVPGYANCGYYPMEAFKLIEALEAGQLSGELKTIAQGLEEDANPVLMVVKFRE